MQSATSCDGSSVMQTVCVRFAYLGDAFIESLTYGRRLAAWALETGKQHVKGAKNAADMLHLTCYTLHAADKVLHGTQCSTVAGCLACSVTVI